jgi:hypothetical protein
MKNGGEIITKWTARVLASLLTGIILLFMFSGTTNIIGIMMQAIPGLLLLGATVLAWIKPLPGGIIYLSLAFFSLIFFNAYEDVFTIILLFGIPALIGALFIRTWRYGKRSNPS